MPVIVVCVPSSVIGFSQQLTLVLSLFVTAAPCSTYDISHLLA